MLPERLLADVGRSVFADEQLERRDDPCLDRCGVFVPAVENLAFEKNDGFVRIIPMLPHVLRQGIKIDASTEFDELRKGMVSQALPITWRQYGFSLHDRAFFLA